MKRSKRQGCVLVFCTLLLIGRLGSAAPPPAHVVVLHNGAAIQGQVQRDGDRFVVSKGPWYVVRVPTRDVDFVARDYQHAYRTKRGRLDLDDFPGHLRLAQWCLKHDLDALAGETLVHLVRLNPHHSAVQALEHRLRRRAEMKDRLVPRVRMASHRKLTAETSTSLATDLPPVPPAAVHQFTRVIQPLLVNRCGQTTCHGRAGSSSFRVDRPSGGRHQEITWTNLRAAMAQINRPHVPDSPLLIKAVSVHGGAKQPGLASHQTDHFKRLAEWVYQVAGAQHRSPVDPPAPSSPTAISDAVSDPFDPTQFNLGVQ